MGLRPYQILVQPGKLYEVSASGFGTEQRVPSIEVIGGTIALYGSQMKPDSPPANMFQYDAAFTGMDPIDLLPNYLYFVGAPASIVLSGVNVKEIF